MPYNADHYVKWSKTITKYFHGEDLDTFHVSDMLLQYNLNPPKEAVAIVQIWIKMSADHVAYYYCYLNDKAERVEPGPKACANNIKYRIDNWLREYKQ